MSQANTPPENNGNGLHLPAPPPLPDPPPSRAPEQRPAEERLAAARTRRELLQEQLQTQYLRSQLQVLRESWSRRSWEQRTPTGPDRHWVPYGPNFDTTHTRRAGRNWPYIRSELDLDRFRHRSRQVCQENPFAKGVLRSLCNYTVGSGPEIKVTPSEDLPDVDLQTPGRQVDPEIEKTARRAQRYIDRWGKKVRLRWLVREMFRRQKRDGEWFLRLWRDLEKCPYLQLRFVEPVYIRNPLGESEASGWSLGIRHQTYDDGGEDVVTILSYHVVNPRMLAYYQGSASAKPPDAPIDDDRRTGTGEIVPADEIIHIKNLDEDSTIKRGLPEFSFDTLDAFERAITLLRNTSESEAYRATFAVISQWANAAKGAVGTFIDNEATDTSINPNTGRPDGTKYADGPQHLHLPKGHEYVDPPVATGQAHSPQLVNADLRSAGTGFNLPENMVNGDASNNSYSSLKEAQSPVCRATETEQDYLAETVEDIIRLALECGIQHGELPANTLDVIQIQVELPKLALRDREKIVAEVSQLTATEIISMPTARAELGYDHGKEEANIAQYKKDHPPEMGMGGPGGPDGGPDDTPSDDEVMAELLGDDDDNLREADNSRLVESALREAGFTGTITDSKGRKYQYQDGKRVAGKAEQKQTARSNGQQAGSTAPPGAVEPAVRQKKHLAGKVGSAVKSLLKLVNAAPNFAKAVVEEAGFSANVSKAALIIATAGDFAIPGLPAASALVTIAATIRKPAAPLAVVRKLIAKIRGKVQESLLRESEGAVRAIGELLENAADFEWAVTVLAVALEEAGGDRPEAIDVTRQVLAAQPERPETDRVTEDVQHAPAGGVSVQGKEYKGGEFIPSEVMAKATDEEKEAVKGDSKKSQNGDLAGGGGKPKVTRNVATRGEMVSARREGEGKEARIVLADGSPAPEHIKAGKIPPAWKDVRISLDPDADILATGFMEKEGPDGAVKKVPKTWYADKFHERGADLKFSRVMEAVAKDEEIRSQYLAEREQSPEEADVTWLMDVQATRPGSEADTKGISHLLGRKLTPENIQGEIKETKGKKSSNVFLVLEHEGKEQKVKVKDVGTAEQLLARKESGQDLGNSDYWLNSYGATTLEARHVIETEDGVRLQFVGKEGVWHDHLIRDKELAKVLLQRKETAGRRGGKLFATDETKVRDFVKQLDGGGFLSKDLRTKRANLLAIEEIQKNAECCKSDKEYKAAVKAVAEKVSSVLGNDPVMALTRYVNPAVFAGWRAKCEDCE